MQDAMSVISRSFDTGMEHGCCVKYMKVSKWGAMTVIIEKNN